VVELGCYELSIVFAVLALLSFCWSDILPFMEIVAMTFLTISGVLFILWILDEW
jgi:hypothetical protein